MVAELAAELVAAVVDLDVLAELVAIALVAAVVAELAAELVAAQLDRDVLSAAVSGSGGVRHPRPGSTRRTGRWSPSSPRCGGGAGH